MLMLESPKYFFYVSFAVSLLPHLAIEYANFKQKLFYRQIRGFGQSRTKSKTSEIVILETKKAEKSFHSDSFI